MNEQKETINDMIIKGHYIFSASSDGTLCVYDIRKSEHNKKDFLDTISKSNLEEYNSVNFIN